MFKIGDGWAYKRSRVVFLFLGSCGMVSLGLLGLASGPDGFFEISIPRPITDLKRSAFPFILPFFGVIVLLAGIYALFVSFRMSKSIIQPNSSSFKLLEDGLEHTDVLMRTKFFRWCEIEDVQIDIVRNGYVLTIQSNAEKIYVWLSHYQGLNAANDAEKLKRFILNRSRKRC